MTEVVAEKTDVVDILVVDDRREDQLAITTVLATLGHRVVTASSGHEALRLVLQQDFAVILLDVRMPGIDGYEVATIIKQRERSRHTPIIFLTAAGFDTTSIYKGYQIGAVDYLSKPIDADVLRAKVAIFAELFIKDRRIAEQTEALRQAERRERELEVAELRLASQRRYRNLAESIPQIVWTASPDGQVDYVSGRWSQFTGRSPDAAKGWGWLEAVDPDHVERVRAAWQAVLEGGGEYELECRLVGKDGASRWFLCRAVPELDAAGSTVAWLGTYTEIHELKLAHAATQEALRLRGEFLSIAAHELNTPLTTMQLQLSSLQRKLAGDPRPEVGKQVTMVLRQCKRFVALVESLLDVSRISSGRLALQRAPVDLVDVVKDVVAQFADQAQKAGCEIELETAPSVAGEWDRLRVEQVVQNLLTNAIKYAPGSPIRVRVSASDGSACLEIQDHGMGIAPQEVERIFGRFERAVPARQYGGLGLGLYIARQVVVAHGGSIEARSEPGKGATFVVCLPMGEAEASERSATA